MAFTGVSLLIGFLPVAPPRLIPSLGMVDLAGRYHQSVYGSLRSGITDQLSSVPSVHIGWAVIVAAAIIAVSRSRWRWLAVLHPVITRTSSWSPRTTTGSTRSPPLRAGRGIRIASPIPPSLVP